MSNEDKIKELEKELSTTKYNKKTQHHIGLVKAKIARLKQDDTKQASKGGKGVGYGVKKSGDATVVLLGYPSVGKSTLLNNLTNAKSPIAAYEFTTLEVIPGVLEYDGAKIQILDIPGIIKGAASGAGRGREVMGIVRSADLILIIADPARYDSLHILEKEVYDSGIRVNVLPPDVKIKRKPKGGIDIGTTVKLTKITNETIKVIMREFGLVNASVVIRQDVSMDEFIDVLEGNRVYINCIDIMNKCETIEDASKYKGVDLFVSAQTNVYMKKLRKLIFDNLSLMRLYMKEPGKDPDLDEPLIIKKNSTIKDVCRKLHKDFVKNFKSAKVWGSSKFPGQKQGFNYVLKDKDILQIVID